MSTPTVTTADAVPPASRGKSGPFRAIVIFLLGVVILTLVVLYTTDHRRQRTAISSAQRLRDPLSARPVSRDEPPTLAAEDLLVANESRGYAVLRVGPGVDTRGNDPSHGAIIACTTLVHRTLLSTGRAVIIWRPGSLTVEWMTEPEFQESLRRTSRAIIE